MYRKALSRSRTRTRRRTHALSLFRSPCLSVCPVCLSPPVFVCPPPCVRVSRVPLGHTHPETLSSALSSLPWGHHRAIDVTSLRAVFKVLSLLCVRRDIAKLSRAYRASRRSTHRERRRTFVRSFVHLFLSGRKETRLCLYLFGRESVSYTEKRSVWLYYVPCVRVHATVVKCRRQRLSRILGQCVVRFLSLRRSLLSVSIYLFLPPRLSLPPPPLSLLSGALRPFAHRLPFFPPLSFRCSFLRLPSFDISFFLSSFLSVGNDRRMSDNTFTTTVAVVCSRIPFVVAVIVVFRAYACVKR